MMSTFSEAPSITVHARGCTLNNGSKSGGKRVHSVPLPFAVIRTVPLMASGAITRMQQSVPKQERLQGLVNRTRIDHPLREDTKFGNLFQSDSSSAHGERD